MKQDEIIEMARQAGIRFRTNVFHSGYCDGVHGDELEAFAKLIAEKEREACAKICDEWANSLSGEPEMVEMAKEIRARSNV